MLAGQGADATACRSRSGERDDARSLVSNERFPDVRTAWQHVQQTVRQAGLFEDPGQYHSAAYGSSRVGLQHHGVAQRERGRNRPDGQDLREVERRDGTDDTDRYPLGEAQMRLLARQQFAIWPGWQRGRFEYLLGRHVRFELSRGRDLAALPDAPVLDLCRIRQPDIPGLAQDGA